MYWAWKEETETDAVIRSKVYFADGTDQTDDKSVHSFEYRKIYKITTSLKQLGYTNDIANPIIKYEVWLVGQWLGGGDLSEKMTYIIDPKMMDYERFYAFGNSYGGVDVVRGTGKLVHNPKYSSKTASVYEVTGIANDVNADKAQLFQYDKKETIYYKGSTGHHSLEYINYLKEILLSDDVRWIDIPKKNFLQILVTTTSVNLWKDDDDLYQLEWEYRFAFDDYSHDKT